MPTIACGQIDEPPTPYHYEDKEEAAAHDTASIHIGAPDHKAFRQAMGAVHFILHMHGPLTDFNLFVRLCRPCSQRREQLGGAQREAGLRGNTGARRQFEWVTCARISCACARSIALNRLSLELTCVHSLNLSSSRGPVARRASPWTLWPMRVSYCSAVIATSALMSLQLQHQHQHQCEDDDETRRRHAAFVAKRENHYNEFKVLQVKPKPFRSVGIACECGAPYLFALLS